MKTIRTRAASLNVTDIQMNDFKMIQRQSFIIIQYINKYVWSYSMFK